MTNQKDQINDILIELKGNVRETRLKLIEIEENLEYGDFENKDTIDKAYDVLNNYHDGLSELIETPETDDRWDLLKALEKQKGRNAK